MNKRPFIRKQKKKRHGVNFWDNEYKNPTHLAISDKPGEDFLKFIRFINKHHEWLLEENQTAIDLGCGNGRHLFHLSTHYNMTVIGIDISQTAVKQARTVLHNRKAHIKLGSIADNIPAQDYSASIILDMMTSHFLNTLERKRLHNEIIRVLKPGGFLLKKTFLLDEDLHSQRLLKEYPGKEKGTYIHPTIGIPEYIYSESELRDVLQEDYSIEKIYKSHKHKFRGKGRKRRTISIYAQKKY